MQTKHCPIARGFIIFIITLIVFCVCVVWIDHPLTTLFYQHMGQKPTLIWQYISLIFKPNVWFLVAAMCFLYYSYRLWHDTNFEKHSKQTIFAADVLAMLICVVVVNGLKILIGRARPSLFIHNHLSGFYPLMDQYNYFSTASGHVMTATAIACIVFSVSRNIFLRIISIALVILVSLSRIILLKHFFGDCIASVGITVFVFSFRDCAYHYYANTIRWLSDKLDR